MIFKQFNKIVPNLAKYISVVLVITLISWTDTSSAVKENISVGAKSLKSTIEESASNILSESSIIDGGNTLAFTGSISLSDGTPVESATILFKNASNSSNPWVAVFSDATGKFKTDLVPGNWTWRVISFNDYGDGSRTRDYPFETEVPSNPSLPRHFLYGDVRSVTAASNEPLDIVLPIRKVRIQVKNETGTAVAGAKIFYSPYLNPYCNQSSEFRYKCLRPMTSDSSGTIETTVFENNCPLCQDTWHTENAWQETRTVRNLSSLGLSHLTNPNYETSTGTIFGVDPENPAVFKSIWASNLGSGLNQIVLPNPVELTGYVTYSNTGLTSSGDTSTIAVVRYYNEILGIASPSTVNVDSLGRYSIKASPNQSGVFEALLRNPDTASIANNLPLENQYSQPGKFVAGYGSLFGQSQFLAPSIETSTSQSRNFTIPSFRKVNLSIEKWDYNYTESSPYLAKTPAANATINTGYEKDFFREIPMFSNLINSLVKPRTSETGTASYYLAKTASGYPNENLFFVQDSSSSMQVPQTCTAMYRADPHECGYMINGGTVIGNWATYKFYDSAVRPLIFTEDTSTISINLNFPRLAYFNGVVKNSDNEPISGALVSIREKNEENLLRTATDDKGYFRLASSPQALTNMSEGGIVMSITGGVSDKSYSQMSAFEKTFFSVSTISPKLPPSFRQIFSGRPSSPSSGAVQLSDNETFTIIVPRSRSINIQVRDPITDELVPNALIQIFPQICSDTSTAASFSTNVSGMVSHGAPLNAICGTGKFQGGSGFQFAGSEINSSEATFLIAGADGTAQFSAIAKSDGKFGQTYSFKVYDPRNLAREVTGTFSGETDETITVRLPAPPPPPTQLLVSSSGDLNAGVSQINVEVTPPAGADLADTGSFGLDGFVVEAIPVNDSGGAIKAKNLRTKSKMGKVASAVTIRSSLSASDTRTVISGLIPGVRYNVQVKSWNEAGFGKARKIFMNNGYTAPTPPAPTPPRTPRPSPTPTETPSPSPSPTESSPTSPSPIPTVSPTPSPSPTPSIAPSPSPAPSSSPAPSLSPTPKVVSPGVSLSIGASQSTGQPLKIQNLRPTQILILPAAKEIAPKIQKLVPNSSVKVFVERNGKKEFLVRLIADKQGNLQLPSIKMSKGKSVQIYLQDSKQRNYALTFKTK